MSESEQPMVSLQTLCGKHRYDLIVRELGLAEDESWLVAELTANILLFQAATAGQRVWQRLGADSGDLSLVFAEIGCLACWDDVAYRRAITVLRKGITHASQVAQRKVSDPDWTYLDTEGAR